MSTKMYYSRVLCKLAADENNETEADGYIIL